MQPPRYKGHNQHAGTLVEALEATAREAPDRGVVHVSPAGNSEHFQSYAALAQQGQNVARRLWARGFRPGDRLIFVVESSQSFLSAFWGCIYAGVVPTPLCPPYGPAADSMEVHKIVNVWRLTGAPILCDARDDDNHSLLQRVLGEAAQLIPAEDLLAEAELHCDAMVELAVPAPDDIAVLQFSSGSTGLPKGVLLSHANLIANIRASAGGAELTSADVGVAWLPYFHDYGLFGCHLVPLYVGAPQVKMQPQTFARRPFLWLEKVQEHGGTFTSSTNTGLEHLLRYIQAKKGDVARLDLSRLRIFSVGAEMISIKSCRELAQVLAPHGFDPGIFLPGYGLTETTMVAAVHPYRAPLHAFRVDRTRLIAEGVVVARDDDGDDVAEFASVGFAVDECELRVTDTAGTPLPANRLGVIEVRGHNVSRGFYGPDAPPLVGPDGWFSTGDMGFMDDEGRLAITGRAKEMIIVHGQNYYPYDIEQIALRELDEDAFRLIVVCGLYDPRVEQERIVLFYVPHRAREATVAPVLQAMSDRVAAVAGFHIHHFMPVTQREIPRTSSGKVMRKALSEQYLLGVFDERRDRIDAILAAHRAPPAAEPDHVEMVRCAWSEVLGVPPEQITASTGLFQLGSDSIKVMRLQASLETLFDVRLESNFSYTYPTFEQQVQFLRDRDRGVEQPRTEFEALLRSVVGHVLGVRPETLGITAELTGQVRTLATVMKLTQEIRRVFAVSELSDSFLELRTIREMAAHLWAHHPERQRPADAPFALMNFQQTLYFHRVGMARNEPTGLSCYIFIRMDGYGDLREDLLGRAFDLLIRSHSILRAVVDEEEDRPRLRILPEVPSFRPVFHDIGDLSQAERDRLLDKRSRDLNDHRFAIQTWPLFLCEVYRCGPERSVFMFDIDHLLVDGYSYMQLMNELFTIYDQLYHGEPPESPPRRLEFRDYVLVEEIRQRTAAYAQAMDFQAGLYQSVPPKAAPPLKRNPAKLTEVFFDTHYQEVPAALVRTLLLVCGELNVTLNSLLLAAYFKLMNRWSRQDDLIINMPVFNREQYFAGARAVLGSFIDIFPVRLRTTFDEPISEMAVKIERFNRKLLEVPVSSIELSRILAARLGQTATSMSSLIFSNSIGVYATDIRTLRALKMKKPAFRTGAPGTYIDLVLYDFEGDYYLNWNYIRSLFDAEFIETLAWQYETLLRQLAAQYQAGTLGAPFTGDGLLTAKHQHLLADLNRTDAPYPDQHTLHGQVLAQAALTPDRLALTFAGAELSYRALVDRAWQVAGLLREQGVGPGEFVALLLPRGFDLLVAQLGVLAAGGAYVPVDIDYPLDRQRYVLGDCKARLLITDHVHFSQLAAPPERLRDVLVIDADRDGLATPPAGLQVHTRDALLRRSSEALIPSAGPDDHAYMIYTSGSTGSPKGVMVRHRNILNFLHWVRTELAVGPNERFALVSSYAFDMTLTSNWVPLMTGASLHILSEEKTRDVQELLSFIGEQGITFLNVTPSHFSLIASARAYLHQGELPLHPCMRIMLGGEVINVKDLNLWLRHYPGHSFINEYGPTEATVASTFHRIPVGASGSVELDFVPIGRPIYNTQIYVLDEGGNPCMPGIAGELCIGGAGVARGYFGKPEQTAAAFVPDPWASPAQLMYRTGDQARILDDGTIEFLGRNDHQINLRGYRIEAGEVESTLREHGPVAEAVVMTRPDALGNPALVAFYTTHDRTAVAVQVLRDHLRSKLPAYMVPVHFGHLTRLPVTPSGKLDHKALPAVHVRAERQVGPLNAPRTATERHIAALWAEVLGTEVDIHDNFWDVGGDSLKSMRLIVRLREEGYLGFGLREAFQHATIAEVAAFFDAPSRQPAPLTDDATWVELRAARPIRARLLCLPYACGNAGAFASLAHHLPEGCQVLAANTSPLDDGFEYSLTAWADEVARWVAAHQDGVPTYVLGYSYGAHVAFDATRRLESQGVPLHGLLLISASPPGVREQLDRIVQAPAEDLLGHLRSEYDLDPSAWSHTEVACYLRRFQQDSQAMLDYEFPTVPLRTPALVIYGRDEEDRDAVVAMPRLQQCFERCAVEDLPGRHMLIWTHPEQLAARVARAMLADARAEE
jgi:amino acid adenylation domain-containing protein